MAYRVNIINGSVVQPGGPAGANLGGANLPPAKGAGRG